MTSEITWDPHNGLAMFDGPGGFTQCHMNKRQAQAIAVALQIPYADRNLIGGGSLPDYSDEPRLLRQVDYDAV